jgi:hypothetical protein
VRKLFVGRFRRVDQTLGDVTVEQAAEALRTYLATGKVEENCPPVAPYEMGGY